MKRKKSTQSFAQTLRTKCGTRDKLINFLNSLCLTERQKDIAELHYLKGWTYMTIGAELDVDQKTVAREMKYIDEIIFNVLKEDYNDNTK